MKKIAFVLLMALVACDGKEPKEKMNTNNPHYDVDFLFEVDGCKVYRFSDQGYNRYLTTCPGSSVQWVEKHGKVSHPQEIQTK